MMFAHNVPSYKRHEKDVRLKWLPGWQQRGRSLQSTTALYLFEYECKQPRHTTFTVHTQRLLAEVGVLGFWVF